MAFSKKCVIFVLGGPGSGKGTVCSYLSREFRIGHLSAGALLRTVSSDPDSEEGRLVASHLANGTIVPSAITCKILRAAMEAARGVNTFLIDGFPRSKENLDGWCEEMGRTAELLFILFVKASEDVLVQRCLERGSGDRNDDDLETIMKRIKTFNDETMPIISHFMMMNMVRVLDASGSKEAVYERARAIFDQSL